MVEMHVMDTGSSCSKAAGFIGSAIPGIRDSRDFIGWTMVSQWFGAMAKCPQNILIYKN